VIRMKRYPNQYTPEIITQQLQLLSNNQKPNTQQIIQIIIGHIELFNQCRMAGGERNSRYLECEYIEKDTCEGVLWWEYNACASACRHMDHAICTLECIPLCSI